MRVIFFTFWGTIGETILEWMINNTDDEVVAVVTRPGEQGATIRPTAFKYYVPYYEPPENINDPTFLEVLRKLEPDVFVSMYFGRLFSPDLLAVPRQGCINMHPSMLPQYRGQGPSTWPIVNGDKESGQTIHWLDAGIDSGDIIAQRAVPVLDDDVPGTLGKRLVDCGIELWKETWPSISNGTAPRIPQDDSKATYSTSAKRKHARINWDESAAKACRVMRAFTRPGKGAWTRLAGVRVYCWQGEVLQDEIEAEGAKPGMILGVYGKGVVVQAGDGQVVLKDTQVRPDGPSLLEHLGRLPGELPMVFV